ncbi:endonuclease III [Candidatus Pacearchaeota archaeon]|nr:endonuclease III [Candidatus Pacearchaeota archaeon]
MKGGEKAKIICKFLKKRYMKHLLDLRNWHDNVFQLLIATILSQRTRDENTEKASKQLFQIAKTPKAILRLDNKKLQQLIKPSGFYRQKAKNIKKVCRILLEKYNGKVPSTREKLLELPGVGCKTADVVLCYGFNRATIPVDVHVAVCSQRLGLTKNREPEKIRIDLEKIVPERCKRIINLGFVVFGKEICLTRKPRCSICKLKKICVYYKDAISRRE